MSILDQLVVIEEALARLEERLIRTEDLAHAAKVEAYNAAVRTLEIAARQDRPLVLEGLRFVGTGRIRVA